MVSPTNLAQDLWQGFQQEIRTLFTYLNPPAPPAPGLYTYYISPPGGNIRLHLRIDRDGSGVLFRDVTEVIHLNPTAVEIAKMGLDDVPKNQTKATLLSRYKGVHLGELDHQLDEIYRLIDAMRSPGGECPTCAVPEIPRKNLFSTPVMAPYKADLALTYGCNNECPHCYNEPNRYPMASMKKNHWFQVIDKLHEIGVPHLILTGGEATLHPDLPEIIRYANGLGHIVGLNTNGRRIAHKPYVETLAQAGLNHIQVTLGSHLAPVHNAMMGAKSFEQTVQGITNAIECGIHTITNTTLMRANIDHAESIIEFIYDLGIRTFAMNGMIYSGGGFGNTSAIPEEMMAPLLIQIRDKAETMGMRFLWYTPTEYCRLSPVELEIGAKRCNAGEYSMCIEPNGDILPCQSYYLNAGNILHDTWDSIWKGDLFRSFRERENNPQWAGLPEKCWECPDLPLCGGGCRIEREARDNNRIGEVPGIVGCSGSCGSRAQFSSPNYIPTQQIGFVPSHSTTRTKIRGTGKMQIPDFIEDIQAETQP